VLTPPETDNGSDNNNNNNNNNNNGDKSGGGSVDRKRFAKSPVSKSPLTISSSTSTSVATPKFKKRK
jgi:hypothetical protein